MQFTDAAAKELMAPPPSPLNGQVHRRPKAPVVRNMIIPSGMILKPKFTDTKCVSGLTSQSNLVNHVQLLNRNRPSKDIHNYI